MFQLTASIQQIDPPLPPRETLPTMYDLPSEDPEEPGLPDEFHNLQPELLSRTFRCHCYPPHQVFSGTDMNLYYDVRHPKWHKRPDWFLVVGVPRLYEGTDLRASYVIWQEGVSPFVDVELLSPGTAKEDLGKNAHSEVEVAALDLSAENRQSQTPLDVQDTESKETPPSKWEVYEQKLRVPYYVVLSRYTNKVRFFKLVGGHYQEQTLNPEQPKVWISELELGLGLWQGEYEGVTRQWLRWYDATADWIPTDTEEERQQKEQARALAEQERQQKEQARALAEQERQQKEQARALAEQAESRLQQVVLNLLQSGMDAEQVARLTGLSAEQVQNFNP